MPCIIHLISAKYDLNILSFNDKSCFDVTNLSQKLCRNSTLKRLCTKHTQLAHVSKLIFRLAQTWQSEKLAEATKFSFSYSYSQSLWPVCSLFISYSIYSEGKLSIENQLSYTNVFSGFTTHLFFLILSLDLDLTLYCS